MDEPQGTLYMTSAERVWSPMSSAGVWGTSTTMVPSFYMGPPVSYRGPSYTPLSMGPFPDSARFDRRMTALLVLAVVNLIAAVAHAAGQF